MLRSLCTLRKTGVCFIAVMSVVFAVFLVWHLVTPGSITRVAVAELLAVLALFILPAATAAAWELDRRAARRIPAGADSTAEANASDLPAHRRIHPPSDADSALAHRRRLAAAAQRTR